MQTVSFDSLAAGQVFTGPGRTLTETDHQLFMMLVGDWHPIHADEAFARESAFGRRVMHGSFGVALAMGMQAGVIEFSDPIVGALGLREWTFKGPLFIGDTVHVEIEILGKRVTSRGDRGIVQRRLKLVNEAGEAVQEGLADIMVGLG